MSRRTAVVFGLLSAAVLTYAVSRFVFDDDLDGLGFVALCLIVIGSLGAAYNYFAHATFNTTRDPRGPEGGA